MSVFIIAEAGSNWRCGTPARDLKMAKSLIDVAVDANANAVKFQTYRAETVYVPNAGSSDYLSEAGIREPIGDLFRDLAMPYEMIPKLAQYCQEQNISFLSTPFSVNDAKAIDPYVTMHKIASYEITHSRLIEWVAQSKKPLILSTGAAQVEDITWALGHFKRNGGSQVALMQCTAKYPAPLDSLNLNALLELKNTFHLPVGLSDHSRDPVIGPVTAVALGATIIEKHYTLHNKLPGPDHSFALTPKDLKKMVQSIRKAELVLGDGKKVVQGCEVELRDYAQRGLQATREIRKGDIFVEGKNFEILRPGKQRKGLHPKYISHIENKRALRNISLGEGIQKEDFK